MKHRVRDSFHSIGDRSGDVAKAIGSSTTHLTRRVGDPIANLARRLGPRRALVGAAMAAIAIGGAILLVRYLRARRARTNVGISREETANDVGSRANERTRSPGAESGLSY